MRIAFGFGHAQDRMPGVGDLALFCPACPQPGINLPPDWKDDRDKGWGNHCSSMCPRNQFDLSSAVG